MGLSGFFVVGVGAVLGAWMRWGLGFLYNGSFQALPLGTLLANLIGGYLMGLLMGYVALVAALAPELRLFLVTGLLGSFTTFSSFSAEAMSLLSKGQYGWAAVHILAHVAGSLAMTGLGFLTVDLIRA